MQNTHVTRAINVRYVLFLACTAALGGLLFGFDIAIITGAGPFLIHHFSLSDIGLGWAFSSLLFGCVLGSFFAGKLTGRYGRKRLLISVAFLFAATSIATALSPGFISFIIARFLGGLAVGGVSLLSPMYASEVSPPTVRGRMGSLYQLSIVIGIVVSYGINYFLRNTGPNNWRWMFLSGLAPSALFLLFVSFAPESPRYLAMKGKMREAFLLLERIGGTESANFQINEIKATMHMEATNWREMQRPGVRHALAVSIWLAILVQISGINTIVDYAPAIFQSAGWKIDDALASMFLIGLTEIVFTILSFAIIDRFGRRPLYMIGSAGMSLCLFALVVAVLTSNFHGIFVLVVVLTYLAFFSACIAPAFWTLLPEIFPNDVRGMAMTVPVLIQWVANAFVVLLFPYAFHVIGQSLTFGFLALMALAQGLFTWHYIPETKNKPLEEIEEYWIASIKTKERKPA